MIQTDFGNINESIALCEKAIDTFGRAVSALQQSIEGLDKRMENLVTGLMQQLKDDLQKTFDNMCVVEKKLFVSVDLTCNQAQFYTLRLQSIDQKYKDVNNRFEQKRALSQEATKPTNITIGQPSEELTLDRARYKMLAHALHEVFSQLLQQAAELQKTFPAVPVDKIGAFKESVSLLGKKTESLSHFTQKRLDLTQRQKICF